MTTDTSVPLTMEDVNRSAISRDTGSTVEHISRIFNPERAHMPSLKLARKISVSLGITADELCAFLDQLDKPDF